MWKIYKEKACKYEQPITVIAEVISSPSAVIVVGKGRGAIVQSTEGPQHQCTEKAVSTFNLHKCWPQSVFLFLVNNFTCNCNGCCTTDLKVSNSSDLLIGTCHRNLLLNICSTHLCEMKSLWALQNSTLDLSALFLYIKRDSLLKISFLGLVMDGVNRHPLPSVPVWEGPF